MMGRHEEAARVVAQQARAAIGEAKIPPSLMAFLGGRDPLGSVSRLFGQLSAVLVAQASALDALEAERQG